MQTIVAKLSKTTYPIHIAAGLLDNQQLFKEAIYGQQVMIVTNKTIAQWYLTPLLKQLAAYQCDTFFLPDGEQYKNLTELNKIFAELITKKHTRKTTLLALGGGVIGDMTGFAAATYLRGVAYVQVPTTLLAQVDASVGGKTAVNHELGKNLIGAFYQPRAVLIDPKVLTTLPPREYREGLAEVIKYGLIHDRDFFVWLEAHSEALLNKDLTIVTEAIRRSCEIKTTLIANDEYELGESRVLLNYGHTFAHAIETGLGYGKWLHGETVAIGMLLAADLSARMGWLATSEVARIKALLVKIGLPVRLPAELSVTRLLHLMAYDKKNIHNRLRLVLLKAIGQACVTEEVMQSNLETLLKEYS